MSSGVRQQQAAAAAVWCPARPRGGGAWPAGVIRALGSSRAQQQQRGVQPGRTGSSSGHQSAAVGLQGDQGHCSPPDVSRQAAGGPPHLLGAAVGAPRAARAAMAGRRLLTGNGKVAAVR